MDEFIKRSQYLGNNVLLAQGAGGNSSIKIGNKLYVKASGTQLKKMSAEYGYACCFYKPVVKFFKDRQKCLLKDEYSFLQFAASQLVRLESFGTPSMETGFHAVIDSKYVFHLHSVYANILGCMRGGSRVITKLCERVRYLIVDYINPGYELAFFLSKRETLPELIFLKNHGIIVHGENMNKILELVFWLHQEIEDYLKAESVFVPFSVSNQRAGNNTFVFPDAAVFSNMAFYNLPDAKRNELSEIFSANNYIINTIKKLKKEPIFLNKREIEKLLQMDQEKHRMEIFHG